MAAKRVQLNDVNEVQYFRVATRRAMTKTPSRQETMTSVPLLPSAIPLQFSYTMSRLGLISSYLALWVEAMHDESGEKNSNSELWQLRKCVQILRRSALELLQHSTSGSSIVDSYNLSTVTCKFVDHMDGIIQLISTYPCPNAKAQQYIVHHPWIFAPYQIENIADSNRVSNKYNSHAKSSALPADQLAYKLVHHPDRVVMLNDASTPTNEMKDCYYNDKTSMNGATDTVQYTSSYTPKTGSWVAMILAKLHFCSVIQKHNQVAKKNKRRHLRRN